MSTAVGGSISRKDGRVKVTGRAPYAADHPIAGVAHAVAIQSTIANGRITTIDSSLAEKAPGVLAIIHHGNAPKLYRPRTTSCPRQNPAKRESCSKTTGFTTRGSTWRFWWPRHSSRRNTQRSLSRFRTPSRIQLSKRMRPWTPRICPTNSSAKSSRPRAAMRK